MKAKTRVSYWHVPITLVVTSNGASSNDSLVDRIVIINDFFYH